MHMDLYLQEPNMASMVICVHGVTHRQQLIETFGNGSCALYCRSMRLQRTEPEYWDLWCAMLPLPNLLEKNWCHPVMR